jgi:hypothetical protein
MHTVIDERGMKCPSCGRDDRLFVAALIDVLLTPDGTSYEGGDHEWGDESVCMCRHCNWLGVVKTARVKEDANAQAHS